jgi:hypothetical protein
MALPSKRFFGSASQTVVAERREGLQAFLNNLIVAFDPSEVPCVRGPAEVPSPCSGDAGTSPSAVVAAFLQMPLTA